MDKEVKQKYIKAGKIAAQALEYGKKLLIKDNILVEVLDKIEEKVFNLGGKLAFPAQVSMDNIAAHFCAEEDDKTVLSNQLCCLDVGVHIDGYIGDNALSVDLSGEYSGLVNASRKALNEAIKIIKEGVTLGEIGAIIHNNITEFGFSPVRNLSGHGLGHYTQHTSPSIPNFDTHDNSALGKPMVFAVEPFASTGSGIVQDSGIGTVFSVIQPKPIRSPITRHVYKEIETYNGLPFAKRWLTRKFGVKANFALRELLLSGIIKDYKPLSDSAKGMVSQAEHTIMIDEDGKVIVTTKL